MNAYHMLCLTALFAAVTIAAGADVGGVVPETTGMATWGEPMRSAQERTPSEIPTTNHENSFLEYTVNDEADSEEIQADVDHTMRSTVREMTRKATQSALQTAPTDTSSRRNAITGAIDNVESQIDFNLVETAAKGEAIQVAKRHAKEAAARASASGASVEEQAKIARATAGEVALAFAKVAREKGLESAKDELALQRESAMRLIDVPSKHKEFANFAETGAPGGHEAANSIVQAARAGIERGISDTEAVAAAEAQKEGLSATQTAQLKDVAADAVRTAASGQTSGGYGGGAAYGDSSNALADAEAMASGTGEKDRISLQKAADDAKKKAQAAVLAKYKKIAEIEKAKARKTLQAAAKAERDAAALVDKMAKQSIARGLDHDLSTKELKHASESATKASTSVEIGVKDAVQAALRQKARLKRAEEKVSKAGDNAQVEAQEKNAANRALKYKLKMERERNTKAAAKEAKLKKEQANEAAHKAIVKVVHDAGGKASRAAARINAAKIQENFVSASCHRHVQHTMRNLAKSTKDTVAKRGLSPTAQTAAAKSTLTKQKKTVIDEVVANAVRRQAHLAAMGAKTAAAARGLSSASQLADARQAWKKAAPKIESFCKPSATSAATTAVNNPNAPAEKINQHSFVVNAVKTMKQAVSKACLSATKPLVIDGAKMAAKHDADYKWQVTKGNAEAEKVCASAVKLYITNAEQKSKEMVSRSFAESSEAKQKSESFKNAMRATVEEKIKEKQAEVAEITSEKMNKQCQSKTAKAMEQASQAATRSVLGGTVTAESAKRAKQAFLKAYHQAVEDGLSDVHAKALARQAADNAKIAATAATEAATSGITEVAAMVTPMSLEQLQADFTHYKTLSAEKRAQERVHKRAARKDAAALQTAKEAEDLEGDVNRVHTELLQTQEKLKRQSWSAEGAATDLNTALLSVSAGIDKAQQQQDIIHAIAKAMKSLHEIGGKTPAEVQVENLEKELREAKRRIKHLEVAASE